MIRATIIAALLAGSFSGPVLACNASCAERPMPRPDNLQIVGKDRSYGRDTLDGLARQERALNRQRDAGTISARKYNEGLRSIRDRRSALLNRNNPGGIYSGNYCPGGCGK